MNPLWATSMERYPTFHLLAFGSLLARRLFKTYFERYWYESYEEDRELFTASGIPFYRTWVENYVESTVRDFMAQNM